MRYSNKLIEQIKHKIILSDFIGRDVNLKKIGRNYLGLSPFNPEKTPSFNVNDEKGLYHCFSSGKGGDIFTYLIEAKGMTYPEAVKQAAEFAGINITYDSLSNNDFLINQKKYEKIANILQVINIAKEFFHQQIVTQNNTEIQKFLRKRNIKQKTAKDFQIGYAMDSFYHLKNYLSKKNIKQEIMIEAGLAIDKQKNGENIYDRFRNRIIFPIENKYGKCIGFGARTIKKNDSPKYINSPETVVFKKNQNLFNIHRAAKVARKKNRLIVVEGYMDVITMVQNGFEETVATLGTSISIFQIFEMWKIVEKPLICLDNDKAGRNATIKIIEKIMPHISTEKTIAFINIKQNFDPDDFINEYGSHVFEKIIQKPVSIIDFLWQLHISKMKTDTPEEKAKCEKQAYYFASLAKDKNIAKHFKQELYNRFRQLWKNSYQINKKQTKIEVIQNAENEIFLLEQIVQNPEFILNNLELVSKLQWEKKQIRQIIQHIINAIPSLQKTIDGKIDLTQQFEKSNKAHIAEDIKKMLQTIDERYHNQKQQFAYLVQIQKLYTMKNILKQEKDLQEITAIQAQIKTIQQNIDECRKTEYVSKN